MDDGDRITILEKRLDDYDRLVGRLVAYARLTPGGRLLLKVMGL